NGAMDQIEGYRTRFEAVEGLYERLFQNIIRSEFNLASAYETAKKFFGTDTVSFAAVDGTEYSRPLFDLVVFLGGSYASRGKIKFSPSIAPAADYEEQFFLEELLGTYGLKDRYLGTWARIKTLIDT